MPRQSYDETFDWGGFNALLRNKDESKDALMVKEMRSDYDQSFHFSDLASGLGGLGTAVGFGVGGPVGMLVGGAIGGVAGGIGAALKKSEEGAETDAEIEAVRRLKEQREAAPSNLAFGSNFRNSGV